MKSESMGASLYKPPEPYGTIIRSQGHSNIRELGSEEWSVRYVGAQG
jgi:hypothetical protein